MMFLLHLLLGCHPREEVVFSTDPRILRGVWEGTVVGYPNANQLMEVRLDLEASYGHRGQYSFVGTIRLEDGEPFLIEGTAFGGQWEVYLQSTIIPPARPSGFIAHVVGLEWKLCGYGGSNIREYYGFITEEETVSCPQRPTSRPWELGAFPYSFSFFRVED